MRYQLPPFGSFQYRNVMPQILRGIPAKTPLFKSRPLNQLNHPIGSKAFGIAHRGGRWVATPWRSR